MDVFWDPPKARANLGKHGVRFADAEIVLFDPAALTIEDTDSASEQRFVTIGRDATARLLVVVYTWRGDNIRLISARRANRWEIRAYEEGL
ncbi:MAG: BrnT family toxin [Gammaproteobacteria bacterium]|nr:BrnT family toxin [Gammaproteobacteria bacterium]